MRRASVGDCKNEKEPNKQKLFRFEATDGHSWTQTKWLSYDRFVSKTVCAFKSCQASNGELPRFVRFEFKSFTNRMLTINDRTAIYVQPLWFFDYKILVDFRHIGFICRSHRTSARPLLNGHETKCWIIFLCRRTKVIDCFEWDFSGYCSDRSSQVRACDFIKWIIFVGFFSLFQALTVHMREWWTLGFASSEFCDFQTLISVVGEFCYCFWRVFFLESRFKEFWKRYWQRLGKSVEDTRRRSRVHCGLQVESVRKEPWRPEEDLSNPKALKFWNQKRNKTK